MCCMLGFVSYYASATFKREFGLLDALLYCTFGQRQYEDGNEIYLAFQFSAMANIGNIQAKFKVGWPHL